MYLAAALVIVAALAHNAFRAWLRQQAHAIVSNARLDEVERRIAETEDSLRGHTLRNDTVIKALAEDFKKKIQQIEHGNEQLRKHIDSQVAGTIAQLPNTGGGFNRRG